MRHTKTDFNKKTYSYFSVDGTSVVLTAGKDGVTEEHIQNLHSLQQAEFNNNRKARRHQLSLERFMDDAGKKDEVLKDQLVDIESDYILQIEEASLRDRLSDAWRQLLPQQRELLLKLHIQQKTLTSIAQDEGVALQTIQDRLKRIDKKLKKILEQTPVLGISRGLVYGGVNTPPSKRQKKGAKT